jgi:hypothetical protein
MHASVCHFFLPLRRWYEKDKTGFRTEDRATRAAYRANACPAVTSSVVSISPSQTALLATL